MLLVLRLPQVCGLLLLLRRVLFCLVSCTSFPFYCGGFFKIVSTISWYLELGHFNIDVFLFFRVQHTQSCHVFSFYSWHGCPSQA